MHSYFGLAIGFNVFALPISFDEYSGGTFYPVVALGTSVMKIFAWKNIVIYLVGCFGGVMLSRDHFKKKIQLINKVNQQVLVSLKSRI